MAEIGEEIHDKTSKGTIIAIKNEYKKTKKILEKKKLSILPHSTKLQAAKLIQTTEEAIIKKKNLKVT